MVSEKKKEYMKQYYLDNKEELKQYMKEYQDKTNYGKKYWDSHKEEKKQYDKQHYQDNKESMKENSKKYYNDKRKQWNKEHSDEISSYMKQWNIKNKDKIKAYKESYFKNNYELLLKEGLITDCVVCGYSKEKFAAIDFHHINPDEKEKQMSPLIHNSAPQGLLEEARKCICLCRNCHSLYHAGDEEVMKKYDEYIKRRNNNEYSN